MPIRGAGPCSLVSINYLQDVIVNLEVWEMVILPVRKFSTASSSCMVR